jgi:hypothetical protein
MKKSPKKKLLFFPHLIVKIDLTPKMGIILQVFVFGIES